MARRSAYCRERLRASLAFTSAPVFSSTAAAACLLRSAARWRGLTQLWRSLARLVTGTSRDTILKGDLKKKEKEKQTFKGMSLF